MESIKRAGLSRAGWIGLLAGLMLVVAGGAGFAIEPKEEGASLLQAKEFFKPELVISSSNAKLDDVLPGLPNRAAWEAFAAAQANVDGAPPRAFIDPRSGAATNILGAFPLIPGRGAGNQVTLSDLGNRIGRPVQAVDRQAVADAVLAFAREHRDLLAVDTAQLGNARVNQVADHLWQVSIPQVYKGIPVRDGRLAASINHGNLVAIGTEVWGDVRGLSTRPSVDDTEALAAGFAYAGGRSLSDQILKAPALEILPTAPQEYLDGEAFAGPLGAGYGHRLAWTFAFQREGENAVWEVIVDAHSGEVLAFQDKNHYVSEQITGGVYPLTNTEICPSPETCGVMQSGWPMPFADTGLASPNNFTNSAGLFDHLGGTVTTTLTGRFVDIVDTCGTVTFSGAGSLDLGGVNGQHDCTSAGGSLGNTASARSAFYEVSKLNEQARGWLPGNAWLQTRITTNVNLNNTCNAFYTSLGGSINFYRSGGGCRNTGEIASVFDHEWGHALDDNDTAGALSNSSEAYADIVGMYRLEASCIGHGFFWTTNKGCGTTADGTGFNQNEAQTGAAHCDIDCSGVRDADWDKHSDHTPDTALGFVCTSCLSSSGPCGRQVHCAAAPSRQAAWDFVARDLRTAPFNLDRQSAFVLANKIFYQGSGNIGLWHACTCGASSDGCGATNAYMQWLIADDDNGNINDGTPHMTALFNAFNRHGIACATPTPVNNGCAGTPGTPTLAASGGNNSATLTWSDTGATKYWVFRTEGHAACNFGKALIGETTGTSFTDSQVANGREYYYNVAAVGSSNACFSPVSNCANVTPGGAPTPDFSLATTPSSLTLPIGGTGASVTTVSSSNSFSSPVDLSCSGQPSTLSCIFSPDPVTPPADGSTTSALSVSASSSALPGTFNFSVRGVSGALDHTTPLSVTILCLNSGASCSSNAQCCSNRCRGGKTKTCQ